ncbi:hypothetical protein QN277_022612 [Acacia crassicarpa]|uniref:BHLH domain-containing protein n=1 Tax=Acacia crassicarpa TaxID=499986 RepID=A0AAE1JJJ5_9FABA|nr:hypothetical protein QN277_022612 [Acacia crassicarpa]
MDHKDDFLNELSLYDSIYEEDFLLREILHQPCFSSVSDIMNTITAADTGGAAVTTTTVSSLSLGDSQSKHDSPSSGHASFCDKPETTSQPTYILSFGNSMVIPATADDSGGYENHEAANTRASSLKRKPENNERESKAHQKTKKSRSSSETLNHIMSERKRRQELSQKFIALSATIPGLKKIDKSTVLSEAIDYVKKLKERVRELEELNKKIRDDRESSLISSLNRSPCHHLNAKDNDHHHHQDTISSSETKSTSDDKCFKIINKGLPEIEARALHNQILIRIHCEKHNTVMLTIFAQLKRFHLSIISSSVLNFANSALDITILTEVDVHKIEVKEVVKKLRLAMLETYHNQ